MDPAINSPQKKSDKRGRKTVLCQKEAAFFLGVSVSHLIRHRGTGKVPRCVKIGRRVLYPMHDIEFWLDG